MAPRSRPLAGSLWVGKSVSTAMTLSGRRDVDPLSASHDAFADTRVKVRIFGIGFFVAAHSRIAIHLHHQRGEHVDADGPCLRRRGRVNRLHQIEVERTADGQALRKNGRARKHRAVRALFVLQKRVFSGASAVSAIFCSSLKYSACWRASLCRISLASVKKPQPGPISWV